MRGAMFKGRASLSSFEHFKEKANIWFDNGVYLKKIKVFCNSLIFR